MIPYIGYIMVMWVCILVGLSGQANKLLGWMVNPFQTIETSVQEEKISHQTFTLQVFIGENKVRQVFAEHIFYKYPDVHSSSDYNIRQTFKIPVDPRLDFKGLRAPPSV